jgi:hypothetical protein
MSKQFDFNYSDLETDMFASDLNGDVDFSDPEALNFSDSLDQKGRKPKARGRKGNPNLRNKEPETRTRQNYKKLDNGDRGYK